MFYSIIQKSQLEGGLRLDAEYYQPEYLELDDRIKKFPNHLLKDLAVSCSSGKNLPQVNCRNSESRFFIRTQNVRPVLIDKGGTTCLDPGVKKFPVLKDGDILAVRVGEGVGNTSIVTEEFAGHTYSDNVLRVRAKSIDPYFLIIFLNSKPGYSYWERVGKGSARSLVSSENLYRIRIPDLGEKTSEFCRSAITAATKEMWQSEHFYSQAENLLLEELGLKNFEVEDDLSYVVNLSEVKSARRMDAEYFQPKYEKLIKHIKERVEIQKLKTIATTKRGSLIDSRFYDEIEGTPYIRGKDFSSGRLGKSGLVYINKDFRPKNETRVNNGDLVFALIGSVGTSALVNEEFNNSFISNNTGKILIKNKKEMLSEYLAIVLNSIVGKLQFEKEASQTAQPKISDSQVRNFYIPILPKPAQQKITDLIQKSHEARSKAKQLLAQAKDKVENLINSLDYYGKNKKSYSNHKNSR